MPRASENYNLFLLKPNLIREWHPTKNGDLRPRDVTPGSGKKVWWLCEEGHEWEAVIYSRSRGSGCPQCYKDISIKDGDLIVSESTYLKEWHPTKNAYLDPRNLTPFFSEKVWWLCKQGHEWQATVKSRMKGAGCPRCEVVIGQKRSPVNKSQIRFGTTGRDEESQLPKNGSAIGPVLSDMKTGTDFRKEKRFLFQDTVMLVNQDSGQWSYARSVNISGEGLLLESEIPFNKGAMITVKLNNPPFEFMRGTCTSIVRWCKELPHDSTASFYGVGVEFI